MKNFLKEMFFKLIATDTSSSENSDEFPSTEAQIYFAENLANICIMAGLEEVSVDKYGYVYATLPANCESKKTIGFISHMDTSPEFSGYGINPQITENYDGQEIKLKGITLSPEEFPSLKNYIGKTIITSDGTTLLGSDDKAGITEILAAVKYLKEHEEILHNTMKIAFTPDEEIGRGADKFDVNKFGCDFAYTVDGGELGEYNEETFTAAAAKITVNGKNIHPGSAKGIMKNAALIACEFDAMIPKSEIPSETEKREGFYHLCSISGNVEKAELNYIIRDFDNDIFTGRKDKINEITGKLNSKYGENTVICEIKDQYRNMYEIISKYPDISERALKAIKDAGIVPKIIPIRGGTDGARLSFDGIPCANLFTGGHNFHGPYEYIPLESMEKAVEVIVNIVKTSEQDI